MVDDLEEAGSCCATRPFTPRGNPQAERACSRYLEVRLDKDLSGCIVNLVDEGFDLALRATGRGPDRAAGDGYRISMESTWPRRLSGNYRPQAGFGFQGNSGRHRFSNPKFVARLYQKPPLQTCGESTF
jgi:hypothetical protein